MLGYLGQTCGIGFLFFLVNGTPVGTDSCGRQLDVFMRVQFNILGTLAGLFAVAGGGLQLCSAPVHPQLPRFPWTNETAGSQTRP